MTWLIGLLARAVGKRAAPWLAYGLVFLGLALALLWMRHDAYKAGQTAENARWEQALDKAKAQSDVAAGKASVTAEQRSETETERVREEKEKIDAAADRGEDPFDVLFPSTGP